MTPVLIAKRCASCERLDCETCNCTCHESGWTGDDILVPRSTLESVREALEEEFGDCCRARKPIHARCVALDSLNKLLGSPRSLASGRSQD